MPDQSSNAAAELPRPGQQYLYDRRKVRDVVFPFYLTEFLSESA